MKKRIILFLIILSLAMSGIAYSGEGNPIVVLFEANPWLMVIGSDSPSFALYDSGLLIFAKDREYLAITLTEKEKEEFLNYLSIDSSFYELKDYYDACTWTDQPTSTIYLWKGDDVKKVSVYGNIRGGEEEDTSYGEPRKETPGAFLNLYDRLVSYTNDKALPWMPEKFEIMIWPYEVSPENAAVWPEDWPDINSSDTKKRGEDSYSIYLNSELYEDYRNLCKDTSALLINGKTWAASVRYPFPNEEKWMK